MAPYRVEIDRAARRDITGLPESLRRRVMVRIEALATDPRPAGCTKLSDTSDSYRVRVGAYRVLYRIRDDTLLVLVVAVGHRARVYGHGG
jgi:mRNA interferase RelE/StbE